MTNHQKKTDRFAWKTWLESNPLVVLAGMAVVVSTTTFKVASYYFEQEKKLLEQKHEADLREARSEDSAKYDGLSAHCHELEGKLFSIERNVGEVNFWDIRKLRITEEEIKSLGEEFKSIADWNCFISVPASDKSEPWTEEEMKDMEFQQLQYGKAWAKANYASASSKIMGEFQVFVWRRPDVFKIDTLSPLVPIYHAFPFVRIARISHEDILDAIRKSAAEGTAAARQSQDDAPPPAHDHKQETQSPLPANETALRATPAPATAAPGNGISGDDNLVKQIVASFSDSDIGGIFLNGYLSTRFNRISYVKGASFRVAKIEKREKVIYVQCETKIDGAGARPTIYLASEYISIDGDKYMEIIETSAPFVDRRAPEAKWITSWLANLRVAPQ